MSTSAASSNAEVCLVCGMSPALKIKLQSASSRLIWWNHTKIDKPLCALCAEKLYLQMQERTLIQGWWGPISALATIFFSIGNRLRIGDHRKTLATFPAGNGSVQRINLHVSKNPAAMVLSAIALLIIVALASTAITAPAPIDSSAPNSYIGSCWSAISGGTQLKHVQCGDSSAIYEVYQVTEFAQNCPDIYISVDTKYACMQRKI